MPSGRLQQQFIRLWQCCEGQSKETTLNELADLLNCSRRHMRTLLNTMLSVSPSGRHFSLRCCRFSRRSSCPGHFIAGVFLADRHFCACAL